MRTHGTCRPWMIQFGALAVAAVGALGGPILVYEFNETGTNAPSTGTDATPLYLYTSAGVCTNLHGAPGSGTTGQAGDRCLDLSGASGMGSGSTGPLARHLADDDAIDDMMSFTQCGWYKTSTTTANSARFFQHYSSGWGSEFSCGGGSTLALGIFGTAPSASAEAPASSFNDANKWMFFAVTYDGTVNTNNVRFYRGYLNATEAETRPVFACVSTNTIDKGKVLDNGNAPLVIGNTITYDRPFRGYLDNLRMYGNKSDASGALDAAALQALWAADAKPGTNLLFEYTFNETGTVSPSTGYYTNGLTLRDATDVMTDLHGPAGSGVGWNPSDRALCLTNATAMGNAGVGPVARHAADMDLADALVSFTVSGWYKTSVPNETPANYARFIDNLTSSQGYVVQNNGGTGKALNLGVNAGSTATANNTFDDANKWVFFAVAYDGTAAANNVRFYRGYRTRAEAGARPLFACVSTNTYLSGAALNESAVFSVGNVSARNRPFRGYMDNVRVFGSKRDGSAALDGAAIEAICSSDYLPPHGTCITLQ